MWVSLSFGLIDFVFADNMFLPDRKRCTMLFLQQVVEGEKILIHKEDVPRCSIPMSPELAVAKLMPIIVKNSEVMKYLTDWAPGSKLPPGTSSGTS